MKTWLRYDGIWVSEKPEVYVVGKDCSNNNILNTDSVVLFQKWNKKLRFGLNGETIDSFIEVTIDKEYGQTTVELFCQNENGTYDTIEL